jgi:undecaprenyl diphosphate synthase
MENNEIIALREVVAKTSLKHIAFIMDGNGRWATKRNQIREMGHRAGAENLKKIVRLCGDIGIHAVTVYAFSTENWKRPVLEVNAIMQLLDRFIKEAKEDNEKNRIRYVFLGDKSGLAPALAEKCAALEELTKDNPSLLNIALNYGGRAELVQACRKLAEQGGEITEADVSAALYTGHCADPDLIVRTAGEYRLSNFLLWQAAYAELYFTDTLWPDFSEKDLYEAVTEFSRRKRRYGGV